MPLSPYSLLIRFNRTHLLFQLTCILLFALLNCDTLNAATSEQIKVVGPMAHARSNHAAAALPDGRIFLCGGSGPNGPVASAEIYNPIDGTFTLVGEMASPREAHAVTLLTDGTVLITGGLLNDQALGSAELFAPSTMTFTTIAPMNQARSGHTATRLGDGRVVVCGGNASGTAEIFDPSSGTFQQVTALMNAARWGHSATVLPNGSIFLAGGGNDTAEIFNPATETFSQIPVNLNSSREGHSTVKMNDHQLLIFGGDSEGNLEQFDFTTGLFSILNPLTTSEVTATLLANRKILVVGSDSSAVYDHASRQMAPVTNSLSLQRKYHSATELPNEKLILIGGGVDETGSSLASAMVYNPAKVTTDSDDYPPGAIAFIEGSGFLPNETIHLQVLHADGTPDTGEHHDHWHVQADENGNFQSLWEVCVDDCTGSLLELTARGETSGLVTRTRFTDGNIKIVADPNGVTFSLSYSIHNSSNCTGPVVSSGTQTINSSSGSTFGVNGNQTIKLTAASFSDQGGEFIRWTGPSNFSSTQKTICVAGFNGGGNRQYNAIYNRLPACTAGTPYVSTCRTAVINKASASDPDGDALSISWSSNNPNVTVSPANSISPTATLSSSIAPCNQTALLTLTVNDGKGGICSSTTSVAFNDSIVPNITCPADRNVAADNGTCSASSVNLGSPVATDNCAVAGVTHDAPTTFPIGTTLVTWTVTDACGNSRSCVQKVTVLDTQAPEFACPEPVTLNAGVDCQALAPDFVSDIEAVDNCNSTSVTLTQNPPAGTALELGSHNVIITATDAAGNKTSCTNSVTILDQTSPTLVCPENVVVSADGNCGAEIPNLARDADASDNCTKKSEITVSQSPAAGARVGLGEHPVIVTASDEAGNSISCTNTIKVLDRTAPSIDCPSTIVTQAESGKCSAVVSFEVTASDNCGETNLTVIPASGSVFPVGTTVVTATARDAAGNESSCDFQVKVNDVESPSIVCPEDVTVSSDSGKCSASNVDLGIPLASDNCGVASVSNDAPEEYPVGTNHVSWVVTDIHGNTNNCVQTIIVTDQESPVITCPDDIQISADSGTCSVTNVLLGAPITTDNCGVQEVTNDAPVEYPVGTNVVVWTVFDIHGNTNFCEQKVIVLDNEAPGITCPEDVRVSADSGKCSASNVALGEAITSDNCGVESVINDGRAEYPVGTNTVTWTVVDIHGNESTCKQTVIVVDDQAPAISCPEDLTVNADAGKCSASNLELGTPLTSDNCGVGNVTNDALTEYPVGTNIVKWVVTDIHGNQNSCTQLVIVLDSQSPKITCPENLVVSTDPSQCSAVVTFEVTAWDNCSVESLITVPSSGSSFEKGTNVVTAVATDPSGNSSSCTFQIIVVDTEKPVVNCPEHITVSTALGQCSAQVFFEPTGNDNCPGITIEASPASGSIFAKGTTEVFVTATDAAGNTSTCSFKVTVVDQENPSISCPANIVIGQSVDLLVPVSYPDATASDNCPGTIVNYSQASGSGFAIGQNRVVCTAVDAAGNSSNCSFTVSRAPLGFTGFLPPVGGADDTGGTFADPLRSFRMGSTIPIKFTATCNGAPVTTGIHTLKVTKYSSSTESDLIIDAAPQGNASTGNQFRLSTSNNEWIFNLDTKATGMSVGKWLVVVTLSDGSKHSAWIQLMK